MKYLTTEKNPLFKAEIEIETTGQEFTIEGFVFPVNNEITLNWINEGYVKEVQEKEFTKDDMIEFTKWFSVNHTEAYVNDVILNSYFKNWLNQRK